MSSPTSLPPGRSLTGSAEDAGQASPSLNARARKRSETRERLFEMALREFREVGLAAAQIDRIAKAAGVARGTFYFHFATKDDVLVELARRINARIARRVAVLGESKPTLRELLLRVNDACMDEHSRVGEAELLADMLSLYVRRPMDVQDPTHNVPSLADELTRHLRAAAERGEMRTSLPPEQVAIVFMSSLFGIYTRLPQGEALREACADFIALLVEGLVPPAAGRD
ncbi:MAG: TetR/AcrR family transcriptional regulator [Myxococcota bacterium]